MTADTSMTRIRRVLPTEGSALRLVRLAALIESPDAFGETLDEVRARPLQHFVEMASRHSSSPTSTTFLLESAGMPIGMIGAFVSDDLADRGFVCALWVSPEHRSTGSGAALVVAAAQWLFDAGVKEVSAWIAPGNHRAIGFYERLGFRAGSVIQPPPKPPEGCDRLYSINRLDLRDAIE